MKIVVKTCADCPLAWHDEAEGYHAPFCNHPQLRKVEQRKLTIEIQGKPPPDWCPLRREGVEIALEAK